MAPSKTQLQRFKEAARKLGTDNNTERFEQRLGRIAKKPPQPPKKPKK